MLSKKLRKTVVLTLGLSILANVLPTVVIPISVYADTNTSESKDESFAQAKEKALEFISKYKFSSNMKWRDFSIALKKELSSEGITDVGSEMNIKGQRNSGVASGTLTLYRGSEAYSFQFSSNISYEEKSSDEENTKENSVDVEELFNQAKKETMNFISTYNFTTDMDWSVFTDALIKDFTDKGWMSYDLLGTGTDKLLENGITGVGDSNAIVDKTTGVVSGNINISFNDEKYTIPFTAQASDINNSVGSNAKWNKNVDGTWSLIINGQASIGWQQVSGKWYHLNQNGIMQTGWFKDTDGKWYFLKNSGDMAYNETVDGYYVNGNGVWVR